MSVLHINLIKVRVQYTVIQIRKRIWSLWMNAFAEATSQVTWKCLVCLCRNEKTYTDSVLSCRLYCFCAVLRRTCCTATPCTWSSVCCVTMTASERGRTSWLWRPPTWTRRSAASGSISATALYVWSRVVSLLKINRSSDSSFTFSSGLVCLTGAGPVHL